MAFISLVPFKIDFKADAPTTTDGGIIQEGTLYRRTLQVRDAGGSPIDCSEYDDVAPQCQFRTGTITEGGVITNCPQPVLSWSNAATGLILFEMRMSVWPAWSGNTSRALTGFHQIELEFNGTNDRTRAFYGEWAISREVTA